MELTKREIELLQAILDAALKYAGVQILPIINEFTKDIKDKQN